MPYSRTDILQLITQAAYDIGVPPEIAIAQAQRESSFNPAAVGRDGERGLMQPLPSTWRGEMPGISFDLAFDPATNLQFWQRYYGKMLGLTGWDFRRALIGYNGGPGALTNPRQSSIDYADAIIANAGWTDRYPSRAVSEAAALDLPTYGNADSDGAFSEWLQFLPYVILGAIILRWVSDE